MEDFNEAMFKTKVDNVFVKLYTAFMKGDLGEVKHFISDDVYLEFKEKLDKLNDKNQRQIYDELNVKNTKIIDKIINNNKEVITVELISRYMDYIIDKTSYKLLSGDNTRRVEKTNTLVFEKKLDTKEKKLVRKCPGCGASISVNTNGKCEYCDTIYNLEDYDYILVSIKTN